MAPSTLYPKIGKLSDVIYRLRKFDKNLVTLSGTIKLHGTHADMVVKGDEIQFQSRNRMDLTLENDNIDFVKFAQPLKSEILALRDLYITRYQSLNPGTTLLPEMPLIIAGEWCGSGGFFNHELNLDHIEASEAEIEDLVKNVERQCPYALMRGADGIGEGIVWKVRELCGDPSFWFKSKGEEFAVKAKKPEDLSKRDSSEQAKVFAASLTTENRMQQGWDFLAEMGVTRDMNGTGRFLSWLVEDCFTEEALDVATLKIDRKKLGSAIRQIGKVWYKDKVESSKS